MRATWNAETLELTIVVPCADPKKYAPAAEGKVYEMVMMSGGFQPTALQDDKGRPLEVQIMAGYANAQRKAESKARRAAERAEEKALLAELKASKVLTTNGARK